MTSQALTSHSRTQRVSECLRSALREGKYAVGSRLPAYRQLAKSYQVSVCTVQAAVKILENEGMVQRLERSGTFVRGQREVETREKSSNKDTLKCVNIVQNYALNAYNVRFHSFISEFLGGCTDALEYHMIKPRYLTVPQDPLAYDTLLSPAFDLSQQSFLLRNVLDAGLMQWLHRHKLPFVVKNFANYALNGLPPHHKVFTNKMSGAFQATEYLLRARHQRIGFVGAMPGAAAGNIGKASQYEGFLAAMKVAGLEPRPSDICEHWSDDLAMEIAPLCAFLKQALGMTAVLTQTDATAICLLKAAQSLGIRVPQELSVIGFNDQPEALHTEPPLTTMAVPFRQSAARAMELLLEVSQTPGDSEMRTCALPCTLVVRGTTVAR